MKTWSVPRVDVQRFLANEYVAACQQQQDPIDKKKTYAVDFFNGGSPDYDGVADGYYNSSEYEQILSGKLPSAFTNYSINPNGAWYTNKVVYLKNGAVPSGGASYDSSYFTFVGTYDIYVSSNGVSFWCYPQGTAGQFDPSIYKTYS